MLAVNTGYAHFSLAVEEDRYAVNFKSRGKNFFLFYLVI
jgi:hypothetical protein